MEGRQDPEWVKILADKELVYSVSPRSTVTCRGDIPYAADDKSERLMDVYTPTGGNAVGVRPAILFVHGGPIPNNLATPPKDWNLFRGYGRLAAAMDLAGVTFNHRLFSVSSYADAAEDVRTAVEYVRANAESLRIDKNNLCVWAFSGGGPLLSDYLRESREYIRCLVAYYAVLDLPGSISGVSTPEVSFSPAAQLKQAIAPIPPMFIARAGLDSRELNATINSYLREAVTRNLSVDFANHSTGHHGFDVEDDNERSREIIRRTLDFAVGHLTRPRAS
jgi:dienelactone hydrolase